MIQKLRWSGTAFVIFAVVAVFCGQANAVNDILTQWTFEPGPAGNPPSATGTDITGINANTGTGIASGHHASALTVWDNPSGNGSPESFSSNNWTALDYYQFQTSTTGVSSIGFQFDQVSSTTGPRDFTIQYSLTGLAGSFTDFANYSVQPNAVPSWGATAVSPAGLDTQVFDLRSVTSLNNAANIFVRLTARSPIVAAQLGSTPAAGGTNRLDWVTVYNNFDPALPPVPQPIAPPVAPLAGDVVFGFGGGRTKTTLDLVRGPATGIGTEPAPLAPWQTQNFIQFPRFDNLGGTRHNVNGNLIGVDGGTAAAGGKIYNMATQGSVPFASSQLIGDFAGTGGSGLTITRLGGPSISPDNTKIAATGFDSRKVLVWDYTAGNTLGGGASLSGARETALTPLTAAFTQGTAWKDNTTVLAFATTGEIYEVNATTMNAVAATTLTVPADTSRYTSMAYNSAASPYIYAMYGGFTGAASNNQLYILDAAYNLVKQVSLSTSMDTAREIALDAAGNLFISQNASRIDVLLDADNPAGLTDNSSVDWYTSTTFSAFNGLDIGFAPAALAGDYNGDGKVNAADYVKWRLNPSLHGGTPGGYNTWRANFGTSGSGAFGATGVPEPATATLLLMGLATIGWRRRIA